MNYLYKITVEVDDEQILRLQQHDRKAVYDTIRNAFQNYEFTEEAGSDDKTMIFIMGDTKDAFSNVGIATNALYDSWLGKYLKRMEWYDTSDNSTEDVLKEIRDFDSQYGK